MEAKFDKMPLSFLETHGIMYEAFTDFGFSFWGVFSESRLAHYMSFI